MQLSFVTPFLYYFLLLSLFYLEVDSFLTPMLTLSSTVLKEPQSFYIQFLMQWILVQGEVLTITLPRFTRSTGTTSTIPGTSLPYTNVVIAPSLIFQAQWNEGNLNDIGGPFATSSLLLTLLPGVTITDPLLFVNVTVLASNGISVYCGYPGSNAVASPTMSTDINPFFVSSSLYPNSQTPFSEYSQMGGGCYSQNKCNQNGDCDYCFEHCTCRSGYGSPGDTLTVGGGITGSCTQRVCPAGKAIADLPSAPTVAHKVAECSNMGTCDRSTGLCSCFPPFGGSACDKSEYDLVQPLR